MRITLTVTEGPHQGSVYTFAGHDTFIVGRSQRAHFKLPSKDMYFSRFQFMVEVNPPQCRLMDMESRNGTHVNGQKVNVVDLKDGDLIRAGKTILRVGVETTAPSMDEIATVAPAMAPSRPPPLPVAARSGPPPLPGSQSGQTKVLAPVGERCRVCSAARDPGGTGLSGLLCAACRKESSEQQQPIAGYQIVRELGKGGMGVVYLALRASDGTVVALKTIIPAVTPTQVAVDRFLRESDILRELDHPHIVAFRDMGESNGQLFFAMDFVRGTDAARIVAKHGPMPIKRAVTLTCQLLDALEYAHAKGFVHRDIKPANLLVTEEGVEQVKLADFGLARTYQSSQMSGLTMMGAVAGTPSYMPPEQVLNFRDVQPTADQYSAAATLYNFLTGKFVFDLPKSVQQQLLKIMQQEPIPIQTRRADIPAALAEIIHKGLAKDPKARFADVKAMRTALAKFG